MFSYIYILNRVSSSEKGQKYSDAKQNEANLFFTGMFSHEIMVIKKPQNSKIKGKMAKNWIK